MSKFKTNILWCYKKYDYYKIAFVNLGNFAAEMCPCKKM